MITSSKEQCGGDSQGLRGFTPAQRTSLPHHPVFQSTVDAGARVSTWIEARPFPLCAEVFQAQSTLQVLLLLQGFPVLLLNLYQSTFFS